MAVLTQEMKTKIQELFPRYPNKQALTLPALNQVNAASHWVPPEAVAEIAELLELAPAEIMDTMSFYGIFQPEPHGKLRCWVCRSLSCAIRGSEDLLQELCQRFDVSPGGTTKDGDLTLEFAECLGACDEAPVMLAGEKRYGRLSEDNLDELINSLRKENPMSEKGK